ncbi:MAG: ABC transporter substrate-binding protein [Anaeroplasmataceae bacterium]
MKIKKILKNIFTLGLASLSVFVASSCNKNDSEKNTIYYSYFSGSARSAITQVADELGYIEEEGIKIEYVNIGFTEAFAALKTNKKSLDILSTGFPQHLSAIARGDDLKIIGGTASEGGALFTKTSNYERFLDFNNYNNITVGMKNDEQAWIIGRQYIKDNYPNIDLSSITVRIYDTPLLATQAAAKGEIDVAFVSDPAMASYEGNLDVKKLYWTGELVPNYVCCRETTTPAKISEKRDAFVKLEKARIRAWEYIDNEANRQSVLEMVAHFTGQTTDYVNSYLFETASKLTADPNKKGIIQYFNSAAEIGFFGDADLSKVKIEDNIDTTIYKDALDELLEEYPTNEYFKSRLTLFNEQNV